MSEIATDVMTKSITETTLFRRCQRRLARAGEHLHRCPANSRWHSDLGDYYVTINRTNAVDSAHLDLVELGRELGVFREGEAAQV